MARKTLVLICILIFLLTTVPAFAAAQEGQADNDEMIVIEETEQNEETEITPESPYYYLDLLMEQIELTLAQSPEARIGLKAEFVYERIDELKILIQNGSTEYIEDLLAQIEESLNEIDLEVELKVVTEEDDDSEEPESEEPDSDEELEEGEETTEEESEESEEEEAVEDEDGEEFEKVAELVALAGEVKAGILERMNGLEEQLDEVLVSGEYDQQTLAKLQNAIHFQEQVVQKIERTTINHVNRLNRLLLVINENAEDGEEFTSVDAIEKIQSQFEHKLAKSLEKSEKAMERLERALEKNQEKRERKKQSEEDDEIIEEDPNEEVEEQEESEEKLEEDANDKTFIKALESKKANNGKAIGKNKANKIKGKK